MHSENPFMKNNKLVSTDFLSHKHYVKWFAKSLFVIHWALIYVRFERRLKNKLQISALHFNVCTNLLALSNLAKSEGYFGAVCNKRNESHFLSWLISNRTKQQGTLLLCVLHTNEAQWTSVSWPGTTGTQRQDQKQKHYWSVDKCSSTSLWTLILDPSYNIPMVTGRKTKCCHLKQSFVILE